MSLVVNQSIECNNEKEHYHPERRKRFTVRAGTGCVTGINTVITVIAGLAAALPFFGARSLQWQISGSRAEIRMV